MKKKDEIKVCLVGSSGGHLTHLYMLKPFWKDKNRFWVTFDKEDARSLLEGEKVYPCYFPTNRSIKALIKNTKIAWDVLHAYLPEEVVELNDMTEMRSGKKSDMVLLSDYLTVSGTCFINQSSPVITISKNGILHHWNLWKISSGS